MDMEKINAIIEVGRDGMVSIHARSEKHNCMFLGCGNTEEEAKEDFFECCDEMRELFRESGKRLPAFEFEFAYDTASFLRYYGDTLTLTGLQKITGINSKQLSHYVTGHRKPSPKTVERIHQGVPQFAQKLQRAVLV